MSKKIFVSIFLFVLMFMVLIPSFPQTNKGNDEMDLFETPLYISALNLNNPKIKQYNERQAQIILEVIQDTNQLSKKINILTNLNDSFDKLLIDQLKIWKQASITNPALMSCYETEEQIAIYLLAYKLRENKYLAEVQALTNELNSLNSINSAPVYASPEKSYIYDQLIKAYLKLVMLYKLKFTNLFETITISHESQVDDLKKLQISEHISSQIAYFHRKEEQTATIVLNNLFITGKDLQLISSQLTEISDLKNDTVEIIIDDIKNQIESYKKANTGDDIANEYIPLMESYIEYCEILKHIIKKETKGLSVDNNNLIAYNGSLNAFTQVVPIVPDSVTKTDITNQTYTGPAGAIHNTDQKAKNPPDSSYSSLNEGIYIINDTFDGMEKDIKTYLTDGVVGWNHILHLENPSNPISTADRKKYEDGLIVGSMNFVFNSVTDVLIDVPKNTACILDSRKSNFDRGLCGVGLLIDIIPAGITIKKLMGEKIAKYAKKYSQLTNKIDNLQTQMTNIAKKTNVKGKYNVNSRVASKKAAIIRIEQKIDNAAIQLKNEKVKKSLKVIKEELTINGKNIAKEMIENAAKDITKQVGKYPLPTNDYTNTSGMTISGYSNGPTYIGPATNPTTPNVVPVVPSNNYHQNQQTYIGPPGPSYNPNIPQIGPPGPPYNPNQGYVGINNSPDKSKLFDDALNTVRQNQQQFNDKRGQQNALPPGATGNQVANTFDTSFDNNNSSSPSDRVSNIASMTNGGNNTSSNNTSSNNTSSNNTSSNNTSTGTTNPPYATNTGQNNYNGSYTGKFRGNTNYSIDPRVTQNGSQSGTAGSIAYTAAGGQLGIDWSGDIYFTVNGSNITGSLGITTHQGKQNHNWTGTINLQTGQFSSNDNTISGTISGNNATGIVKPDSKFDASKN